MKTGIHYILKILIFLTLTGCVDEVTSEPEFDPQIFITGSLNAVEKNATLRIQRTIPVNSTTPDFINNAQITLYTKDQQENTSVVTKSFSVSDGSYQTTAVIEPIVGNQYWVEINIPNEDIFRSTPETLKKIIPINSITIVDNIPQVNFDDPEEERNFYYLSIIYLIDFNAVDADELVLNDILFNGNKNAFLKPRTNKFFKTLSVSLNHINSNTYQYLTNILTLKDQNNIISENENPGELFSTPPINVTGNMMNVTKNKAALGNFSAVNFDTMTYSSSATTN